MTSPTDTRLYRPDAIAIAKRFLAAIEGTYETLTIAGSLRRRLAYVGDIEVVAVPAVDLRRVDLLGDTLEPHGRLNARMAELLEAGTVAKRLDRNGVPRWGPTLKLLTFEGAKIDLFTPCAERYGWILLLRTGPAAFSRQLVVPRGTLTKDGRPGLLPPHILPRDGWLTERVSGYRIPTPTEHDAFEALRLPYREPWERT